MDSDEFIKLPFLPIEEIPPGSKLIPVSSIFEDYDGKGYILIPPDNFIETEKDFEAFREKLVNAVIDMGLKKKRESEKSQNSETV